MFKKIKLQNKKTEKEKFVGQLENIFEEADKELEEIKITLQAIFLDNDDMRATLLDAIKRLDQLRLNLFKHCCLTPDREFFDTSFCSYRDFLIKYNNYMDSVDIICSQVFEDAKKVSQEIIAIKKNMRIITNENITEHSKIHQHNEPYLQQIEQLQKKREEILKRPGKKNEQLFA